MEPLTVIHQRMKVAASTLRLPLRRVSWRGLSGNYSGSGTGNSLDFQDHRPYVPGDDPRHINWQAYARTGQYTMKLYRQEVSPRVDLILDVSASMFFDEKKAARVWELLYFSLESAFQLGASPQVHALLGEKTALIPLNTLLAHRWQPPAATTGHLGALARIPFRHGSLRVLITDLLFPCADAAALQPLAATQGRGVIYAPFAEAESQPDWEGNIAFEDVESTGRHTQRVTGEVLQRYLAAYRRHFEAWQEQCRRFGLGLARIPARGGFLESLRTEALATGAVEL